MVVTIDTPSTDQVFLQLRMDRIAVIRWSVEPLGTRSQINAVESATEPTMMVTELELFTNKVSRRNNGREASITNIVRKQTTFIAI